MTYTRFSFNTKTGERKTEIFPFQSHMFDDGESLIDLVNEWNRLSVVSAKYCPIIYTYFLNA